MSQSASQDKLELAAEPGSSERLVASADAQDLPDRLNNNNNTEDTEPAATVTLIQDDQELSDKYRVVNMTRDVEFSGLYEGTDMDNAIDLIVVIMKEPQVASNVEDIAFLPDYDSDDEEDKDHDGGKEAGDDDQDQ